MKDKEYILVSQKTVKSFTVAVNVALNQGFELYGPAIVLPVTTTSDGHYFQPMVKHKPKECK